MPPKPPPTPRVFVSATSADLASLREVVKIALLDIDCMPIEEANFPPDYRSVTRLLEDKIAGCHAVVHIVGMRYGSEPDPATLPEGTPRLSYTQLEADMTRRLGKKLFIFVCPEDFPYDAADPEAADRQDLQQDYRSTVEADNRQFRNALLNHKDAAEKIRELRVHIDEIREELLWQKRLLQVAVAAMLILALVAAGYFYFQGTNTQKELAAAREQLREIKTTLDDKFDHLITALANTNQQRHARDIAAAEAETDPAKREQELANAQARFERGQERVPKLAANLAEAAAAPQANPYLVELARRIENEDPGTLEWLASQQDAILAEADGLISTNPTRARELLQTLLYGAEYAELKGNLPLANAWLHAVVAADPTWNHAKELLADFLLHSIGPHSDTHATLAECQAIYEKAHELFRGLLQADPNNRHWQRGLSVCYRKLGDVAVARRNLIKAELAYWHNLSTSKQLAESDPTNSEWQLDLSISYEKLGDLKMAQHRWIEAEEAYQETLSIVSRLASRDHSKDEWKRHLSVGFNKIGDVAAAQSDFPAATIAYKKSLDIIKPLAESDRSNTKWQRDLSISYSKLGDMAVASGNVEEASKAYQQVFEIALQLAESDRSNYRWQRDLSISYDKLGAVALEQNDLTEAVKAYQNGLQIAKLLVEHDPSNNRLQRDLSISHLQLAYVYRKQKHESLLEEIQHIRLAYEVLNSMANGDIDLTSGDRNTLRLLEEEIRKLDAQEAAAEQ